MDGGDHWSKLQLKFNWYFDFCFNTFYGCTASTAVVSFFDDVGSFHFCTFPLPNTINTHAGRIYRAAAIMKTMLHSSIVFCKQTKKRTRSFCWGLNASKLVQKVTTYPFFSEMSNNPGRDEAGGCAKEIDQSVQCAREIGCQILWVL